MRILGLALAAVLASGAVPADASPRWTVCADSCSFDVPAGDYEIDVVLGGPGAGSTGLDVEARRIALAPVATEAGQYVRRSVTVEVRTPEGMPSGQDGPGTPGLQVHLTGPAPRPVRITVTPRPKAPRIFVISDSTAGDWANLPKNGWAQALPAFFRAGPSVRNYAQSGASTVSYLDDPRYFARVRPMIRPGDTVLIQLAHNDKQTTEDVYRANLATLVAGVRAQGGAPVMVTPPVRHRFGADGRLTPLGLVVNNLGVDLPAVLRDVARRQRLPLLDLTAHSQALLEGLGEAASWPLYLTLAHDGVDDATHLSRYGAEQFAALVAQAATQARLPIARFLRH
ncbi:GDSL-type esterase/lipase family protein [Amycolatopsis rifamycinica]|uniref:Rhamnogalacturonan acetylesterase n=1 Tax=Amycolatopsis rifamycinica TaxID=287986 RepID=A0A066TWB7_9PSEU|nr:GDSL-type esterase/lipase family protein [Amycolatopsis rifamycinica]KDN19155.1 rhamnogalacturonan acetylesterase [Amycolatopsis rifamycinica]